MKKLLLLLVILIICTSGKPPKYIVYDKFIKAQSKIFDVNDACMYPKCWNKQTTNYCYIYQNKELTKFAVIVDTSKTCGKGFTNEEIAAALTKEQIGIDSTWRLVKP